MQNEKILLLIRSLSRGGAERQLVNLAIGLKKKGYQVCVAVFYLSGDLEQELHRSCIPVISFEKSGRWDFFRFFFRVVRLIRRERFTVILSYLTTANVLASLAVAVTRMPTSVIWGVRASNMRLKDYSDWLSHLMEWVQRLLRRCPSAVISNSQSARNLLVSHSFSPDRVYVVPNGIDIEKFKPLPGPKEFSPWRHSPSEILVGVVARIDPMKGHSTFIKAAAIVYKRFPNTRFVCAGGGDKKLLAKLKELSAAQGISDRVIWAGSHNDVVPVYRTLDLLCSSSSFGEGFSNSVAEALACELPCVVTDTGDSALIVGDRRFVVPPENPEHLAEGLCWALQHLDTIDRAALRERIVKNFSINSLVENTEKIIQAHV